MARGNKLKVKVVNAYNLTNKETLNKSDPMCMVELGKASKKTKAISNNLNPEWNEEFTFDVTSDSEVLSLSIWDHNTFRKDVFMGCAFVAFDGCKMGTDTSKVMLLSYLVICFISLLVYFSVEFILHRHCIYMETSLVLNHPGPVVPSYHFMFFQEVL